MQITIRAKQLGRKQDLIQPQAIEVEDIGPQPTAAALITAVVRQQVAAFNSSPDKKNLLPVLDQSTIDTLAANGKVGFGNRYNEAKANPDEAVQTALLAFQDGIFVLFAGDDEITKPEQVIPLQAATIITFIRLTFLAGSYW